MKKCQGCNNLVKNSYTNCYDCNSKVVKEDKDSGSEPETTPYKKETIPKTVRNCLWINYFGSNREGKCCCCKRETISIGNFHAGHIIAEVNGGKTSLDNMRPICMLCNTSMQRSNMDDFIVRYNLNYGL